MTDIADRLLDLERRVAALEERTMPRKLVLTLDGTRLAEIPMPSIEKEMARLGIMKHSANCGGLLRLDTAALAEAVAQAVHRAIHDAIRESQTDEYGCPPKRQLVITIDGKRLASYLV